MKLFVGCLIGSLFCVALADVKTNDDNKAVSIGKAMGSKPKRDAPLISGLYHGPSYKYLPPAATISATYDTYPGKIASYAGYFGSALSGLGSIFRTGSSSGHGHRHHVYAPTGTRHFATYHGLETEPTLSYGGGHQGYIFPTVPHHTSQGSTQFNRGGYKGVTSLHTGAKLGPSDFSANRHPTFVFSNGNSVGSNAASGSGYQYTKGFAGSHNPVSTGFQSADGFISATELNTHEEHHGDHVHNGAPEHLFVVSNIPAGFSNPYDSKQTSVHQQALPATTGGSTFNTKYYSPAADQGPAYASGHKGLGHFGFTANKPQVLHAGLSGTSFQQHSYSKAPFKPSTFLGAKFEGSAVGDIQPQQYLPPLAEATSSTGYDYQLPTENYQEPTSHHHHQTVDVQSASLQEPDSAYLPTQNKPDTGYEFPAAANANYLPPPTDSYGNTYAH